MKMLKKIDKAEVKSLAKRSWKKTAVVLMSLMMLCCVGISAFAANISESTPVSYSDFSSIFTALQEQISVSTVVGVLAAVVGACVGLVFMWWGLRKVVSMLMAAFRKGKMKV